MATTTNVAVTIRTGKSHRGGGVVGDSDPTGITRSAIASVANTIPATGITGSVSGCRTTAVAVYAMQAVARQSGQRQCRAVCAYARQNAASAVAAASAPTAVAAAKPAP